MASEKNAKAAGATRLAAAPTAAKAGKTEQKYTVAKLRGNCMQLFGVTTSTFDGAMHGHNKAVYSVGETKEIIEKWLKGSAKGGND